MYQFNISIYILKSIVLPKSIETIGEYAFQGCTSLTNIELPEGLETIGESAFEGCTALTNINFPQSLKSIGESAFNNCTGLTQVEFPQSLSEIRYGAFSYCTGLTQIACKALTPPLCPDGWTKSGIKCYVPQKSVELYKRAEGWREFNIIGYDF